jgi:signal transduction histidine kinase/CheY-like chemotaxis protein
MLAELENSRERQAEREAAQVRESELQAMTIARQRNLNRALMAVTVLMAMAILFAALFIRYRSRVMRKLEIKTREAASAEKLKTEFLGMISHELRTPLNGIIGISDYLANYHADADIRQKTGIVLQSGNELLAVVESLTDMARIDAGQLTLLPHDANLGASLATVPEKWKEKAAEKNLVFTHFIDPDISAHYVDEDRILQCIDTLLANAISFTDTGRVHLHITASKTEPAEMHIIVADTGRGMSELVQSRLFTPFMQADTSRKRNHMGTGLNLAIAYALAEMMEGSLSCISRDGRGSEFKLVIPLRPAGPDFSAQSFVREDASLPASLSLPVEQETPKRPEPVLNTPEAPQRDYVDLMQPSAFGRPGLHQTKVDLSEEIPSKRILIVDDIESNRDVLRLILETNGHICSEAGDGYAALAKLDQQGFDLVILDIHMTPMDGVEALRRIRSSQKAYANIPVIALTADNAPNTNAESIKAGANLFLEKPVKLNELLDALDYLEHDNSVRILSQNR